MKVRFPPRPPHHGYWIGVQDDEVGRGCYALRLLHGYRVSPARRMRGWVACRLDVVGVRGTPCPAPNHGSPIGVGEDEKVAGTELPRYVE